MLEKKDIEHIATLSRLALTEQEQTQFAEQLSAILDFVRRIQEINTTEVLPLNHVTESTTVWRDDEPQEWPDRDGLLDAAPRRRDDYIETPSIF